MDSVVHQPLPIKLSIAVRSPSLSPNMQKIRRSRFSRKFVSATRSSVEPIARVEPLSSTVVQPDRIFQIHNKSELEAAIENSGNKLVVIEYASSVSKNCARIYPTVAELSQSAKNVEFLLIIADESEETLELFREANITTVPHFVFKKNGEIIHEELGVDPEQLASDVLYYAENVKTPITYLHGEQDLDSLVNKHKEDHKLVIVDITLNNCGPCARVWPTVVKLAGRMSDSVVFAKLDGEENESCKKLLTKLKIQEVPTFLFYRNGALLGKYVGSGRGDLIGEVLRYQGVQCT